MRFPLIYLFINFVEKPLELSVVKIPECTLVHSFLISSVCILPATTCIIKSVFILWKQTFELKYSISSTNMQALLFPALLLSSWLVQTTCAEVFSPLLSLWTTQLKSPKSLVGDLQPPPLFSLLLHFPYRPTWPPSIHHPHPCLCLSVCLQEEERSAGLLIYERLAL